MPAACWKPVKRPAICRKFRMATAVPTGRELASTSPQSRTNCLASAEAVQKQPIDAVQKRSNAPPVGMLRCDLFAYRKPGSQLLSNSANACTPGFHDGIKIFDCEREMPFTSGSAID